MRLRLGIKNARQRCASCSCHWCVTLPRLLLSLPANILLSINRCGMPNKQNETATAALPGRRRAKRLEPDGGGQQARDYAAGSQQAAEIVGRRTRFPDLHPPRPLL